MRPNTKLHETIPFKDASMVLKNTTGNPLSAGSLALFMATSLPKGDARQLKNGTEAIALAVHAGMLAVGFRLIGLGEDERIDAENPQPLPTHWNASSSYAFRYAHAQSAMEYLIKASRLGGKAVVYALALGDDKTTHFEVVTKDYVSESQLPFSVSEGTPTEHVAQKVQELFISVGRLNDLGSLLKISVIQKLAPGLNKPGYEESITDGQDTDVQDTPAADRQSNPRQNPRQPPVEPHPFDDRLGTRPQPDRHLPDPMPGFDDELDMNRRPGRIPAGPYPVHIGQDDLYPPGLRPTYPSHPLMGGVGGGGMQPTFGGQGRYGVYDPVAPSGARYDPLGPFDSREEDRGMGSRFPGRGGSGGSGGFHEPGGRPPNPFGGFGDGDFI
ncbi:pi31 proteasome regulator [Pyrenophora seminiperda CCB06]|uniref:Pi31 proteasome regulator n=1 Tax=Pyrenophora seminiperda CCB06 TaxID=1302712 RepID=A0A3M7ME49_9PLEO|nr:pi31 proteasome regulator [Pyrenophora seminiperda CCB06]